MAHSKERLSCNAPPSRGGSTGSSCSVQVSRAATATGNCQREAERPVVPMAFTSDAGELGSSCRKAQTAPRGSCVGSPCLGHQLRCGGEVLPHRAPSGHHSVILHLRCAVVKRGRRPTRVLPNLRLLRGRHTRITPPSWSVVWPGRHSESGCPGGGPLPAGDCVGGGADRGPGADRAGPPPGADPAEPARGAAASFRCAACTTQARVTSGCWRRMGASRA